jgi:aldehyde dehydrogenase (NAD+)
MHPTPSTNGHDPAHAALTAIPTLVAKLRLAFDGGRTRPIDLRLDQLARLRRLFVEREDEILDALQKDVGKPAMEGYFAEVAYTLGELDRVRKNLREWARPERVSTALVAQPGRSSIVREPLGVVLIIGPWNYPFHLVVAPLIGAIAAGNCVVVKPSEVAPATSALLAERLPQYLDPSTVAVVQGGVAETTALLREKFDHIFYTGNGTVGRVVMEAAAKHLTPVTLELGGKSPCIVDDRVDLDVAVKRILWGKFYNAGQTCVAPDYVLAHARVVDRLVDRMKATLLEFYGPDPKASADYGRIVNARHHRRLMALIAGGKSGTAVAGGVGDEAARYIAPTILRHVPDDAPVMRDEIFGPILPVLPVDNVDAAIAFVNGRPKPLALYVFSSDTDVQDQVVERTSSGGVTVNHTWLHLAVPTLPFGGVGESGMGSYHGRRTYETFCHQKSVLVKPTFLDPPIVYPPYSEFKKQILRRLA